MKNYIKTVSAAFATFIIFLALTNSAFAASPPVPAGILDPTKISKWVNQLVVPPVYFPTNVYDGGGNLIRQDYQISMTYGRQTILPPGTPLVGSPDGKTLVWGYQGDAVAYGNTLAPLGAPDGTFLANFFHSPSSTFEATRGVPVQVKWINNIDTPQFLPVDPTIHWADPNNMGMVMPPFNPYPPGYDFAQYPVPLVPHLHGGEDQSYSDGGPEEWFTYNGIHGADLDPTVSPLGANYAVFYYPNDQQPVTMWYHDHALGMTRLNVMSGLAGYYLLRENASTPVTTVTTANFDQYLTQHFLYGVSDIPIAIQDRTFYTNGELWFPTVGINPNDHPYWFPEFFGNTIMVNGRVWPNLDVTAGWYRLRLLEGSNARFYTLSFLNKATGAFVPFIKIGGDGGFLMKPTAMTSLTFAPGERADVLINFSGLPVGTTILLKNTAKAPFPAGTPADPQTVGQIMQFTVVANTPGAATHGATAPTIPAMLNPTLTGATFPTLATPATSRTLTLFEVMGPLGPLMVTLNGQKWAGVTSELPKVGTTEDWYIVDLTGDTHPIHTHLATFQLVSRQKIDVKKYTADWIALQQAALGDPTAMPPWPENFVPTPLAVGPYLQGKPMAPPPAEQGWKDTIQMNPGEVTIIRIRFTQQDGTAYTFDPTAGPGYVWHCHIVDHEDNEMMRRYLVVP